MRKHLISGAGAAVIAAALCVPALAQTTVTSTAPSETTINVGQLLAPWLQILIAGAVAVVLAIFGWLTNTINKRAGLQSNAAVLSIEGQARDALQSALTNAAGLLIMKAGPQLDTMKLDVRSPLIAQAVNDVNKMAGDAVARFGITPETVGAMIIAKLGVLTGSNPNITPTTSASTAPLESTSSAAASAALKT